MARPRQVLFVQGESPRRSSVRAAGRARGFEPPHDLGARLPRSVPVHVFQGMQDETVPAAHSDLYARAIPQARVHRLAGRDHQLGNDLSEVASTIVSADRSAADRPSAPG
jgi:pimeloyl-ACP methyl ester carboxylesterase